MKALTDREIEVLKQIATVDKDKGTIHIHHKEESPPWQYRKHYIYLARWKGWKTIQDEKEAF